MMIEADDLGSILTGQLNNLPPLPPNVVKIYICANAGEFDIERKYLWQEILPDLQSHCMQQGIDVIFIDMLLGNRPDTGCSMTDLNTRLAEIEICHSESVGPFFLGFVGDKYGNVPLPQKLDEAEFTQLCEAANKTKSSDLIKTWYSRDDNAVPVSYVLSDKFDTLMLSDPDWRTTYYKLMDIFKAMVTLRKGQDKVLEGWEKYFTSALARQVNQTLRLSPENSVFVFRSFQNKASGSADSKRKQSVTSFESDTEKVFKLKDDIHGKVEDGNIIMLRINAKENTIFPNSKRNFEEYIETFLMSLTTRLIQMIDRSVEHSTNYLEDFRNSFEFNEALVHLHHCASIYNSIPKKGFEKHLSKLQALLINGARVDHQLSIIKSPDGCGKTSIITKMCYRARDLFGKDTIVIPIFIGLTARSCLIEDIFRSICSQINMILKQELNIQTYTLKKLTNYYHGLMNRVSKSSRHLLIFLDGLDKLQQQDETNFESIDWLVSKLPPKFHIIVSCTSVENASVIKRLESKLVTTDVIVFVGRMTNEDCSHVVEKAMTKNKRKLTDGQHEMVLNILSEEKSPLIADNIIQMALKWRSDYQPLPGNENLTSIPKCFETLVTYILTSIEMSHGYKVASALCGYITLSRYGLTESELLDVLSANDDILLSIYKDESPALLRFPSYIWSDIRDRLGPVLTKRYVAGKTLFTWAKKSCVVAVRQRYLSNPEEVHRIHRHLAAIFLEQWETNNPFAALDDSDSLPGEIDRLLSPQPLVYNEVMYNMRKLQELWFHLLKSGDIETFKKQTFCNFEYLLAMVDSDQVQKVMYNIELVKPLIVDVDIHILDLTLRSAGVALHTCAIQLANELIGRMRQIKVDKTPEDLEFESTPVSRSGVTDYFPQYIDSLVTQCMEWCDSYTLPLLVPLTTWLDNIHQPFMTSFTIEDEITSTILLPNGQHVIVASSNVINMYHLATTRLMKSFKGHIAPITSIYFDTIRWRLISAAKDKTLRLWDFHSELCVDTFRDFKTHVTCMCSCDDHHMVCGTEDGSIVVRSLNDGVVVNTLTMHRDKVTDVRTCKSNTILVSSSLDCKVILWYTGDWSLMTIIDDEVFSPILCIDISKDSTFLMAGCDNGSLHVIAMATGSIAQSIYSHKGCINSVSICNDCHHCVAASSSGEVYLYNFRTTEVLDVFSKHKSDVISVMLSENQQLAVTTSRHDVCVWSLLKRYTKESYQDVHSGTICCLGITSDSKRLISGSLDGLLKTWNLDISDFADNFVGHTGPITCLSLAMDNSFVVSGSSDLTLKVWSLITASVITNYKGHEQVVTGVHVLSDNRLVLSMDVSQKIHMWRAEDGQTIRLYAGPTVMHTLTPNSTYCISGAGDNRLQIWKLSDGSVTKEISHKEKITCLLCSRDSQYLCTGSMDKSVKVWEIVTGKIVQIIVDQSSTVRCLAITEDNETILSAGDNGVIQVCSLSLGTVERKLLGHFDTVTVLKLTADDAILISGCLDQTIRVWNYRRGHQLTMFDCHYPIINLVITDTATRIGVQLSDNNNVPILCLHNTPSKPKPALVSDTPVIQIPYIGIQRRGSPWIELSTTDSQMDLVSDFSSEGSHVLPIKPKPAQRPRVSGVFRMPSRRRLSSVSSIPQIIRHSPIKAPIQTTMKAQEKRRLKFPLRRSANKPKSKTEHVPTKRSNICCLL